ncbi:Dynein regulatory complex subunit 5 [Lamellibrachia satsuma]|nr:Dynein regulatory complex subunit 5 [Lamellibrachia satsuma]
MTSVDSSSLAGPGVSSTAITNKSGSKTGSRAAVSEQKSPVTSAKVPSPTDSDKDNPAADHRSMRRIIAEDPEWSLAIVPTLVELCIKHLVFNFEHNSKVLHDLEPKHKAMLLEKISTDIPLKVTALLVDDEGYWQRCCKARWQICDVSAYGRSWKRMYFERHLQRIIEHYVPETTDPTELNETLPLCSGFVRKLDVRQLLPPVREAPKGGTEDDISEADASDTTEGPGDRPLRLRRRHTTSTAHRGVEHRLRRARRWHELRVEPLPVLFSASRHHIIASHSSYFTARDCLLLAKCVAQCKTLKVFKLNRSKVDDDKVRVLISHLLDHPSITKLDLSHNVIGDRGARAIGKFLNNHSQLTELNIYDNNIRAAGAQAIAHALTKNTLLTKAEYSNELSEPTAATLSQVVVQNTTLRNVELSCNRLGPDGGKQMQEGMEENETITYLDLRLTEVGQESEYCINQILHHNRERARAKRLRISFPSKSSPSPNQSVGA